MIVDVIETGKWTADSATTAFLAHHCVEAGLSKKAADYFFELGQTASESSANIEAAAYFQSGLDILDKLPDNDDRRQDRLKFLVALGPAIISTHGPGSPEAEAIYQRAITLCEGLPETAFTFAALWGYWRISMDLRTERERANRLIDIAYRIDDRGLKLQAHHCQWATLFNLGAHRECIDHVNRGLAIYDQHKHKFHASFYGGHDPRVCGYAELALSQWLLGFASQATASLAKAEAWAARLEHAGSIVHAMDFGIMLQRYRRDAKAVRKQAARMTAFAQEQSLRDHEIKAGFFRAWADCILNDAASALEDMNDAMMQQIAIGTAEDFPVYYEMLAEIYQRMNRWPEALAAVENGFLAASNSGLAYWNAELYRRRAELLWLRDQDGEAAAADLMEALRVSQAQNARMLELRAAMTGARFTDAISRKTWLERLRVIMTTLTEGQAERDLVEAKALLARENT